MQLYFGFKILDRNSQDSTFDAFEPRFSLKAINVTAASPYLCRNDARTCFVILASILILASIVILASSGRD